jgi:hypothetical protein
VRRIRRALLGLAAAGTAVGSIAAVAAACEPPAGFTPHGRLASGDLVVLYRTLPGTIEVGRHIAVEAVVCGGLARVVRVDADMPEHRHGMNYRAHVRHDGAGRYLAEGLLVHMPGRWRLLVDVERDGQAERLATDLVLE